LAEDEASVALALASHSAHPLSRALATALASQGNRPMALHAVHEEAGNGMAGLWLGRTVSLGRPSEAAGSIATELVIAGRPSRLIRFTDRIRPDAAEALSRLKALGIPCSILSGDNTDAVANVARELGLEAEGMATPASKGDAIARLQNDGRHVLMIGDGLNDGPALAAADASMAPGSASDVGRQAADLVFTSDSLLAIPRSVLAARRTMRVVKQNFALAVGYNALAVPLAMMGKVTPLIAAVAMSTSSLIVVANSLRLARAAR
jgi:Cu2+-exporting ATPase